MRQRRGRWRKPKPRPSRRDCQRERSGSCSTLIAPNSASANASPPKSTPAGEENCMAFLKNSNAAKGKAEVQADHGPRTADDWRRRTGELESDVVAAAAALTE